MLIRKIYRLILKVNRIILYRFLNRLIHRKTCNICGNSFFKFIPYQGGVKGYPKILKELKIIGSDIENFACPFCQANDRTRHIFLFFEKIDFWKIFEGKKSVAYSTRISII